MKGSSANQVKPVRILEVPPKQKFFLSLVEEGQEVPNLNETITIIDYLNW